uniref:Uncharacterized protein n=1 Tax=Mus spicilegus TaxID=10103 RepID=A0A8C6GW94_MUSSI
MAGPLFLLWTPGEGYLAQHAQKNFSSPFAPGLQFERIREFPAVASSYYLAVAGRRVWFHGSKSSINQDFWERVKKGCSTAAAMGGAHTQPCTWPHTYTLFVLGPVPLPPRCCSPFSIPLRYTVSSALNLTLELAVREEADKLILSQCIWLIGCNGGCPPRGISISTGIKALNQRNRALKTLEFQASASGKGVFKLRGNEAFFGAPEITSCRQLLIC